MSLEDLRDQGVLLPEDEWGAHALETTVNQFPLLLIFLLAAGSLIVAYFGNGNAFTWIGVISFFAAFFGMVWLCDRAVRRQRKRFQHEHEDVEHAQG